MYEFFSVIIIIHHHHYYHHWLIYVLGIFRYLFSSLWVPISAFEIILYSLLSRMNHVSLSQVCLRPYTAWQYCRFPNVWWCHSKVIVKFSDLFLKFGAVSSLVDNCSYIELAEDEKIKTWNLSKLGFRSPILRMVVILAFFLLAFAEN